MGPIDEGKLSDYFVEGFEPDDGITTELGEKYFRRVTVRRVNAGFQGYVDGSPRGEPIRDGESIIGMRDRLEAQLAALAQREIQDRVTRERLMREGMWPC